MAKNSVLLIPQASRGCRNNNEYPSKQGFQEFFVRGPILTSKNNQGSSIRAQVNVETLDDRYSKLKI
jgi:hypothetical protein